MASVDFIIGNSYTKLPISSAKLDKSGQHSKVHDWTLFLDIINGNPDIIERVQFDLGPTFCPNVFNCSAPIQIKKQQPNGSIQTLWRFKTRQQTYGSLQATLNIRGVGGTFQKITHQILLQNGSENLKAPVHQFVERRPMKPFKHLKLPDEQRYGIELELTSANHVSEIDIAQLISEVSSGTRSHHNHTINVDVIRNYSESHETSTNWKIVPDSSIVCNTSTPDCNTFELVSPILKGGVGLSQINKIAKALQTLESKLKVNKSMGFHLHIDVSTFNHSQLVKICQNFIKYEDVIDTFMPISRRTGSAESNKYFQSNRQSIVERIQNNYQNYNTITNKICHEALSSTNQNGRNNELYKLMNNSGRYYKLNLQNLTNDRQPTIEFRQHSATINYDKISNWVRFCVAFCTNSAKLASPTPFSKNRSLDFKFDALFQYVIKDRALRDYYAKRRTELTEARSEDDPTCGCADAGSETHSCSNKHCRR